LKKGESSAFPLFVVEFIVGNSAKIILLIKVEIAAYFLFD